MKKKMSIDERILYRVTCLHNKEFLNQKKIAERLRITPKLVNYHIEEIKSRANYINLDIKTDERYKYELILKKKFNLNDVFLVKDDKDPNKVSENIGKVAADFVSKSVKRIYIKNKKKGKNEVTIALGHGSIIKTMIENMTDLSNIPLTICAIVNDPFEILSGDEPQFIDTRVFKLAAFLRGKYPSKPPDDDADVHVFPREIPMNRKERSQFVSLALTKNTLEKLKESDILIYGVGGFIPGTIFHKVIKRYEKEDNKSYISLFNKQGCVGGLGGSIPINKRGEWIKSNFDYHLLGLKLSDTEEISRDFGKFSIVVSHGKQRAHAIKATIENHKYANVLITDLETGKILFDL
jgi:DNA-binding transcriptional regulator LsrR (DeoR family)